MFTSHSSKFSFFDLSKSSFSLIYSGYDNLFFLLIQYVPRRKLYNSVGPPLNYSNHPVSVDSQ